MHLHASLGLALGGGGARGGVHIGLLKVLDREGIAVGPIAGTSAGGLVGGLYAAGLPAAEIERLLVSMALGALIEADHSGWSLVGTGRFIEALRRRIGDLHIEALPHPFAAVAVDLRSCREMLLAEGPLLQAIQATIAVPGILCPVPQGDALLVDGGLLNNLPVDVARKLGAGRVLAVHLSRAPDDPPSDLLCDGPIFGPLHGAMPRLLDCALRLTGRQRAMVAVGRSISILTSALLARRLEECPPDLLLRPALSVRGMELRRLPEAIAAGERLAEAHLDEIRSLAACPVM